MGINQQLRMLVRLVEVYNSLNEVVVRITEVMVLAEDVERRAEVLLILRQGNWVWFIQFAGGRMETRQTL